MGFAYKKISPDNIKVNINEVNKQYKFEDLLDKNISIYFGENIPLNRIDPLFFEDYNEYRFKNIGFFDSHNDTQTTNNEYRRLIFSSIKHLFYKEFIGNSGSLSSGSRYDYFPQTSRYSGSFSTTHRNLEDIQGLPFEYITNNYNENISYDDGYLYDSSSYEPNRGNLISVLSVSKNIYGNNIQPQTFQYSDSLNYIRDDGEGNLYDFFDEDGYNNFVESGILTGTYIGNIIYALGLIIITDSRYLCLFSSPPVLLNDYYQINNIGDVDEFNILINDYSDCSSIDNDSITLVPLPNETFPDCYIDNGMLKLIDNQSKYIPGNYKIGYNLLSMVGIESNTATVNLRIGYDPLDVNFEYSQVCLSDTSSTIPFSLNISKGVPVYEYSFDFNNWTQIPGFGTASIDGYVSKLSSSLYVRDYIGNVFSSSIEVYNSFDYDVILTNPSSCNPTGSIMISASNDIIYSIDGGAFTNIPNNVYPLGVGTHEILLESIYGCVVQDDVEIVNESGVVFTTITSPVKCFGGSTGAIQISSISGGVPPYLFSISSGSYNSTSSFASNLKSGSYLIEVMNGGCIYQDTVDVLSNTQISSSANVLFNNACYPTIELIPVGGIGPYTYTVISPNHVYGSNNPIIPLDFDGIQGFTSTFTIKDSIGCLYNGSITIPGRKYEYFGSYCEQD